MAKYEFTNADKKRIARATYIVEHMPKDLVGPRNQHNRYTGGFWALLGEQEDGKYSWKGIKFNNGKIDKDYFYQYSKNTDADGYAVELYGSTVCLLGDIVYLQPAMSGNYYIFDYNPGVLTGTTKYSIPRKESEIVVFELGDEQIEQLAYNPTASIAKDKGVVLAYSKQNKQWIIIEKECN